MSLALVRVDDRLLHGQVLVGWGRALDMERVVLVDDGIAEAPWEQELYRYGVPEGMEVVFDSVDGAVARLGEWEGDDRVTVLVVGTVETLVRLCAAADIRRANLGGLHHRPDRRERLPYVFLADEEATALQQLARRGVEITAQDVPTARAIPLDQLL